MSLYVQSDKKPVFLKILRDYDKNAFHGRNPTLEFLDALEHLQMTWFGVDSHVLKQVLKRPFPFMDIFTEVFFRAYQNLCEFEAMTSSKVKCRHLRPRIDKLGCEVRKKQENDSNRIAT